MNTLDDGDITKLQGFNSRVLHEFASITLAILTLFNGHLTYNEGLRYP